MAISEKKRKAQQIRDDYRKLRAERAQAQPRKISAVLKPPVLTDVIADPTDGTLKGPLLKNGLTVNLVWWDNLPNVDGDQETVTLQWAKGHDTDDTKLVYEDVDSETYIVPYPSAPNALTVPSGKLTPDGPYTLKYSLLDYHGDRSWSAPVPVICDQTPPKGALLPEPDAMIFPVVIITDAEVDSVEGTIPPYVEWNAGDTVIYGWERVLPDTPEELPFRGPIAVSSGSQTVAFDAAHIKDIGDGHCFVSYALLDKATNRSSFAAYTRIHVALGPLPANLHLPQVALAVDGIDLDDAIAGVYVDIPLYDNCKSRDEIEITWGATILEVFPVGPSPNPVLSLRVPSATLKSEYGGETGNKETNVSYRVLRGGAPFGGDQAIKVDVDFWTIGPPRPDPDIDWPDPVNSDLDAGTVTSASGEVNELRRDDEGSDATFKFALYDPVHDGETITFYWDGIYMPEADFTVDGEAAGAEIPVTVLWKYIEQAGNKTDLAMHYRIGSPGSRNEQQSPDRVVNANAVVVRPDAATFRDINGAGWLTCASLDGVDHAVVVVVPDLSKWLSPADNVNMKWWALPGRTGDPLPITGTTFEEPVALTDAAGAFPVTGFEWRVTPPETYVLPTYVDETNKDGRGRVTYSFTHKTETITSKVLEANVGMHEATQPGTCPITPRNR